ncbi:FHA domain-containing protein FhaB/FipA [Falsarthrobacter nasiphocae]|uniref:PSer/pThr/pTyr-binding forkhead associated (FHA) protein n=1 Tax=Falsarthrobacter nasiphocae TaxID=189863 RepID=A0AAE3YH19_9MICC|nr:FHA domain-containing protein [Falsarthrobacter nasiphocae]MDR6892040.1 pSer/pThr/pTyr-binding forkhead associated (FHA) protein [Falsarthrobacter nasiphocae]
MSELTITAIRFAFLILLWVFVAMVVGSLRRDLGVQGPRRTGSVPAARQSARAVAPAAAAPAPARTAPQSGQTPRVRPSKLVVTEGPQSGTVLDLADSPVLLGRAQEATLVLADDYASGRHARLFPQGSRWFIEDLGSTNGTFVGSEPLVRAVPVEPGAPLRIGKTVFELRN